ncbi:MAG: apolipoprotein N-acyltransferase [Fimbriiglobus sp.]
MPTPRVFLPAILSGVLLWTAFFPLDLGPVAFVALVPFLTIVRADVRRWKRYAAALAGGLVFAGLAFKWVRVAHPMMALFAWPAASLYLALYWPAAVFLLRRLDRAAAVIGLPRLAERDRDGGQRRPPFALTLPVVWVALEYFRAHFPTGFPFLSYLHVHQFVGVGWYGLGYTQHRVLPLIQVADVGGIYAVTALVAAANGAAYEWALRSRPFRWTCGLPRGWVPPTFTREFTVTAFVVLAFTCALGYGGYRLVHTAFEIGPRVAILQGNLPQNEKLIRGELKENEATPLEREYFPLAKAAAGDGTSRVPELTIWPETCFPDNWYDIAPGADPATAPELFRKNAQVSRQNFAHLTGRVWKAAQLYGLNGVVWDGTKARKHNSALFVRADGTVGGRYDKTHLVPFGEYVPLKDWFPWMQTFTPYTHDYSCTPGDGFPVFELPSPGRESFRFGVLICYEDSDPYLARQYHPWAGRGPGADFLVNISNDGWFDGTEEHEQHFAICRFRAVEARRAVVRAVNMGISGVIDGDGRVVALPRETWSASKKVTAIVREEVPIDRRDSVYAAAGDWLPGLCWLLIAASGVGLWFRRSRKTAATDEHG